MDLLSHGLYRKRILRHRPLRRSQALVARDISLIWNMHRARPSQARRGTEASDRSRSFVDVYYDYDDDEDAGEEIRFVNRVLFSPVYTLFRVLWQARYIEAGADYDHVIPRRQSR